MYNLSNFKSSTALSVIATLIYTGSITPVSAQDTEDVVELEEIVVTGSRIPRKDLLANSPVTVVSAEEFVLGSVTEVEDVLSALPQTVGSNGPSTNNPGNGQANVNLRNLGTSRTLVLVNGRRFVGAGTNGVVDLNNIPTALIQRVEIATGGASAVYGSDAIAGVVNFILKKDFEGFASNVSYGITQEGDGQRINADLTVGANTGDDRGNVVMSVNYFRRDQILAIAREHAATQLSEVTIDGAPGVSPGGSTTVPQGRFNSNQLDNEGILDSFGMPIGANGIIVMPDGSGKVFTRPADEYNFAVANNLLLPLVRYTFSANGGYQITDGIRFFAETNYAHNKVERELAPTPFSEAGFEIDLNNPFIPAPVLAIFNQLAEASTGSITTGLRRRMLEAGSRNSQGNRSLFRVTAGFEGQLSNGMSWDIFYNYGQNTNTQFQTGNIVISKFQQGLLVDPANPSQCRDSSGGCVVLNPFGEGVFTEEMADFVKTGATNVTTVTQQQLGANIAGELAELPGGAVGVALGVEYRKETGNFNPDTFLASGDIDGFNAGTPTVGSYDVKEVFAEAIVPILSNTTGAEYFGLELGIRFSDYSSAGGVTSYKAGGEWSPIAGLKVRGLYQRAVRAPNIQDLFLGNTNSFPGGTDLCNDDALRTQTIEDFCVNALGVPADEIAGFQQENSQIETIRGGNPDLFEETSDTWSIGVVYQPEQVEGLTITADLYSIKIADAIARFGGGLAQTITACRGDLTLENEFCQALTARRSSDGQLEEVDERNANIANLTAKGVDFSVNYMWDTDYGAFNLNLLGAYNIKATTQGSPLVTPVRCENTVGVRNVCGRADPKWRATTRLTHRTGAFTTSVRYRYIGSVEDERLNVAIAADTAAPDLFKPIIEAKHYIDLSLAYEMDDNFTLYTTINNAFNTDPPFIGRGSAGQFNTDSGTYDVIGRRFTFGIRTKF